MFVCLSSGASIRYRQDILRALALPKGSVLQFRYDRKWVAKSILDRIAQLPSGTATLIAYVDQHDNARTPEIIPCRMARLEAATAHGTTVSLELSVDDFAYAENLPGFNTALRSGCATSLPSRTPEGAIQGHYWLEATSEIPLHKSAALAEWEKIIIQLADHQDFNKVVTFLTVMDIRSVRTGRSLKPAGRIYSLQPDDHYEFRLYHFHPKEREPAVCESLAFGSALTIESSPRIIIDSRYDLKRIRVATTGALRSQYCSVSVKCEQSGEMLDFDIGLRIGGKWIQMAAYGILLGLLLASPHVVAALYNPDISERIRLAVIVSSCFTSIVAGLFTAIGLKASE